MRNLLKIGLAVVTMVATANAYAANVGGGNASAGNSNLSKDKMGLSISTASNTMISGKYFIDGDTAFLGGFGLLKNTGATDLYFMGGLRKYLPSGSSDVVPFIGGRGWYSSVKSTNVSNFGFAAEAGAEYFLDKRFSLEGTVSVGYASTTPTGGSSSSTIGTSAYSLGANFYF